MKIARGCAGLLILVLAGVPPAGAAALEEPAAAAAPRSDELRQLDGILDLLIDRRFAEARDQATRLLEREDLPEAVATWAVKLREKAEERLEAAGGEEATSAAGREAAPAAEPELPAPEARSFPVRQALIGGGFSAGVSGSLRISTEGLAFTPVGRAKAEWSVRWQDFSAARRDGGIWDAPEIIAIVDRRGAKHYLAQIDGKGRYLSAGPLLSAIEQGRKQWRSAAKKKQQP